SALIAQGCFPEMRELSASGTQIGFYGMTTVNALKELEILRLRKSNLNDGSLQAIGKCSKLRVLEIGDNPITDMGTQYLSKLKSLEEMSLADCRAVTDRTLNALKGLKSLKKLDLSQTS